MELACPFRMEAVIALPGHRSMRLRLNTNIYPKESILTACYNFLDRAYIYLEKSGQDTVTVSFDLKKRPANPLRKNEGRLRRDFLDDLIHQTLRYEVSRNNKRIREMIIERALTSALPMPAMMGQGGLSPYAPETIPDEGYLKDPLGIAIPWEKKFGKKRCRS